MSDGEAITKPAPGSAHDASDESGAESDPEEVRSRLERYEEELRALRCPLPAAAELPAARYRLRDLLPRVLPALERYDTAFLTDYLAVLWRERPAEIERVTCDVMASIEDALRQQAGAEEDESCALGEQRVVLCAFLCAACLADTPRVRDARPALRQLLQGTSEKERELLAELWWRALPAAALMQLSDAVRAPRRAALHDAPSLAELLLRAALCRLPPDDNGSAPEWELGAPKLEDLERVLAVWERQQQSAPAQDAERVMLFGRVLAVAPPALRPPLMRRLGAARPALLDDKLAAARADRKVGVCKLQILFGAEDKLNIHKPKTPLKHKAKKR
ncbi:uncharacterized protein LOC123877497 isoform X2 [Maniola jurtina]|uniref:uncharacterized protein LOC123877497 isoform X2 n=1 Tax=Maniola jurtina TaxID=191418 RepID=UPI001E6872F3|nr:uncharacterized protein LOC123877497 isoform X2 [Maniola jurtina]